MISGKDIVLNYVVPTFGSIISVAMFLASMPAVLKARTSRDLGVLNLIPYPAIIANCIGWVVYSFVVVNGFVLAPNAVGLVIGLFYTMTCASLAPQRTLDIMALLLVAYGTVFVIVGAVGSFRRLDAAAMRLLWGYTSNAILLTYYAAPLTTLWTVLRTRCADSLSLPLSVMNAANGALWLAYGLAIGDPFISVPNGIGLGLAVVLLACKFAFWKRREPAGHVANGRRDVVCISRSASSAIALRDLDCDEAAEVGTSTSHSVGDLPTKDTKGN